MVLGVMCLVALFAVGMLVSVGVVCPGIFYYRLCVLVCAVYFFIGLLVTLC